MASVNGTDSTTGSSGTSASSPGGLNALDGNSFLKLLTAQLKSQDPESAADPSQFVNQLAQFSQLEQLIQIRQLIQDGTTGAATDTTGGSAQA